MNKAAELLPGTLDMLILRTLLYGPAHGHQIGKHSVKCNHGYYYRHGRRYSY